MAEEDINFQYISSENIYLGLLNEYEPSILIFMLISTMKTTIMSDKDR